MLARWPIDSARVTGQRVSFDPGIQSGAGAGRRVPSIWLSPAQGDRHERIGGGAVRARRHAAGVIRPFAPQWRPARGFAHLCALGATLRRKSIAHAIGRICGCRIEPEHRRNGQYLKEGSHEGEVKVYRSDERLQEGLERSLDIPA